MSRICAITGAKPVRGSTINRSGKAKKKGGIGMHVTGVTSRLFNPNLHAKRLWVAEQKRYVKVKLTARGLKTLDKKGVYPTLKKLGLI
ncbi:MAG: 50S ribosomal protein L28 [bacterium]